MMRELDAMKKNTPESSFESAATPTDSDPV